MTPNPPQPQTASSPLCSLKSIPLAVNSDSSLMSLFSSPAGQGSPAAHQQQAMQSGHEVLELMVEQNTHPHDPSRRSSSKRKRQFRFSAAADVMLLREVVAVNPFEQRYGNVLRAWQSIAQKLAAHGILVDGRRCRERTQRLLEVYKKEDFQKLRKSATLEEYEEKETLLQEISSLISDVEGREVRKQSVVVDDLEDGSDSDNRVRPRGSRRQDGSVDTFVWYLREKRRNSEKWTAEKVKVWKEELEYKKRKLDFEIKRWEEERKFQLERFKTEQQERQLMIQLLSKVIGDQGHTGLGAEHL